MLDILLLIFDMPKVCMRICQIEGYGEKKWDCSILHF